MSKIVTLLSAVAVTGAGSSHSNLSDPPQSPRERCFQVSGATSSGSGAATVKVQVSLDDTHWEDYCTFSLTLGTTSVSDGLADTLNWPYVRGNVTAISGTGANVTLKMGG